MIKQTQMKSGPPGAVGQRWAVILAGGEVGLVFGVRRFWEKPSRAVANDLMCRGCFWNAHPGNLAVSCNRTLEWTDVGDVDRALSLVRCEVPQMEGSDEQETVRVATAAG